MKFHEKLDLIMNITKTTNSSLSKCVSLDSSHISRLRRGERRLVSNADYIRKMSTYFVSKCINEHQKNFLCEILKCDYGVIENTTEASEKLYNWFIDSEYNNYGNSFSRINGLIDGNNPGTGFNLSSVKSESLYGESMGTVIHYGDEGKRQAVEQFLSLALKNNTLKEVLLYSDESMDWLTQDNSFQMKWMKLMLEVIKKGIKIKVIHTVSRDFDEMMEALNMWIPLYLTGSIEPYYYPKKRDGIFKNTLFVAQGIVALYSNSIDGLSENSPNILVKDKKAVEYFSKEFNAYLDLCRPLMEIYNRYERENFFSKLDTFETKHVNTILKTNHLSLITMPENVVTSILDRMHTDKSNIYQYYLKRKIRFIESIKSNIFTEIIRLPNLEDIRNESIKIGYTGIRELEGLSYNTKEFRDHLANIYNLLKEHDNYNVCIDRSQEDDYRIYVKEDFGVIVERVNTPNIGFLINEINITATFWDYLQSRYNLKKQDKKFILQEIRDLIDLIEEI